MPADPKTKENLIRATDNLILRVESLTTVVETNNREIGRIRREVNRKPDDSEIQFITGMARRQRRRHLQFTVTTTLLCAVFAGLVSYNVANHKSQERCKDIRRQSESLIQILSEFKNPRLQFAIDKLTKEKVECDK